MPLRGFVDAFWTLIVATIVLVVIALSTVPHYMAMMERHPALMDLLSMSMVGLIAWRCSDDDSE